MSNATMPETVRLGCLAHGPNAVLHIIAGPGEFSWSAIAACGVAGTLENVEEAVDARAIRHRGRDVCRKCRATLAPQPTATEDFERFRAEREAVRAEEARLRIVFRKAYFRYSEGRGRREGYVGRIGETETRVYYTKNDDPDAPHDEMYEWGDLVGSELQRLGTTSGSTEASQKARQRLLDRASALDGDVDSERSAGISPTTRKENEVSTATKDSKTRSSGSRRRSAATAAAAPKEATGATPAQIRADLVKQLKAIKGVSVVPNKDNRFDRFTIEGKSFVLVFAPSKSGVALQIPRPLLGVEKDLPKGSNFKTTKYGLTRTLKSSDEVTSAVAALKVASDAVVAAKKTAAEEATKS